MWNELTGAHSITRFITMNRPKSFQMKGYRILLLVGSEIRIRRVQAHYKFGIDRSIKNSIRYAFVGWTKKDWMLFEVKMHGLGIGELLQQNSSSVKLENR